ncbi:hypothetical protein A8L34_24995 [Bacillus sp. FJAT-27264]|uniref:tetratricopeptide repeat protein n=1 Tax=Paenibacillus sp. (strain DSM 101736 / FJAT-27264) TaxID=1850362 RepID=UPI0008081389|nr:tetratricopeptide repeat protein [Bacillus sp. FJAT-27264]OBZ07890.1 hypothetical protein A8L34_24995 [Bacillus sp. FJAT-27264]
MENTSIILFCDNELSYTIECIQSIRAFTEKGTYELIAVVNNNASDEEINWFMNQTDILISSCDNGAVIQKVWNNAVQISKGDNVLFMHSSTVVTENWLTNLIQGLYTSEDIAAVGPLSNYATNDSQMNIGDYSTMEELALYSKNQYFQGLRDGVIEKCLTISDFCFLIKKSIWLENGEFDEKLELDSFIADYCLRLLAKGYQTAICRNVYIHHYGRFNRVQFNDSLFIDKWSFGLEALHQKEDLISHVDDLEKYKNVLVLGCGCGALLKRLSYLSPEASIRGIEINQKQAVIASSVGNVTVGTFSNQLDLLKTNKFDCVLVTTEFFNSESPLEALKSVLEYLEYEGKIVIEVTNPRSYETFKAIFSEQVKYKNYVPISTLTELDMLFEENNLFKMTVIPNVIPLDNEAQNLYNATFELMSPLVQQQFNISRFIIIAKKQPGIPSIQTLFDDLLVNYTEEKIRRVLQYEVELILSALRNYKGPAVALLNLLAIESLEQEKYNASLLYLNQAFVLAPEDSNTLFNLGTLNYVLGNLELSLEWLLQIRDETEVVKHWIDKIQIETTKRNEEQKQLKLLLLRIEYNVLREESLVTLLQLIEKEIVRTENIIAIVHEDIIDIVDVLNSISRRCYSKGDYKAAITLLEKSLEYDPEFEPTILYLASTHIQSGEYHQAYQTLDSAPNKTPVIHEWKKKVEGVLMNMK